LCAANAIHFPQSSFLVMVESRDVIEHEGGALNGYLKLCQQRKVVAEELLIAEIATDPVCERTTSIDCSLGAPPLDGGQ